MTREEAFPGAHMHRAPDLTLALRDHGFISVVRAEQPVRRRPWIDGTHRPEGVFIAGGEGIQAGLSLPPLSIMDVAPALLYSLDLPIPEDLEGRLASEIFEPSFIEATPPALVSPPSPWMGDPWSSPRSARRKRPSSSSS